jgi:hypothetical protein
MGEKSASGSGIWDEQPGSYFPELRNHFLFFFWVKILQFLYAYPGWRQFGSGIRDGDSSDPGSGMETVRIRDPEWKKVGSGIRDKHPGSATLVLSLGYVSSAGTTAVLAEWCPLERVCSTTMI